MDAHVLVQIVTAAELPFAPPNRADPRFIVRVNRPDVPFEMLASDETLAAAIDVAGICPGALLRPIFAACIDGTTP